MSISNPNSGSKNPAKKFIKFSGSTGGFTYYDKEKKENIQIKSPFTFTVLDELSTITGWQDSSQSGIYSNEIHNIDEEIRVKASKGGDIVKGFYANIKDKIKSEGGRYAKSIYALLDGELVNIQLYGASLSPWIDKEFDVNKVSVRFGKCTTGKKGNNEYKIPIFESVEMTNKEEAIEEDKKLQEYLKEYKNTKKKEVVDEEWDAIGVPEQEDNDPAGVGGYDGGEFYK